MRRRIFIAISVAAIPVLLMLALVLLLPAKRVGAFVERHAEAALKREVKIERIHIRIAPRLAVVLDQVSIAGVTRNSKFAAARRIELRPKILPLFQRRAVIDEIIIDRPRVLVSISADGTSNFPTFKKSAKKQKGAELRIREVRIQEGTFVYRDARNGTAVRLAGVNETVKLSGPLTRTSAKPVNVGGRLAIKDIDANLPGRLAWPLRNVNLHIEHDLSFDRAGDRIDIEQFKLAVQEIELMLDGAMGGVTKGHKRAVHLRVSTGAFDIEKLIASLPQSVLEGRSGEALTGAAGHARIGANVSGQIGAGELPRVQGVVQLKNVALARGKHGQILNDVNGNIAFSLDSIATTGITGDLLGERLRLAFNVHELGAPHGKVSVQTTLALAEVEKLGLFPKGTTGRGHLSFDVTATGSMLQPKEALLHGYVSLNGVQVRTASLQKPIVVAKARIKLQARDASAQQIRASIGRSDVAVDFTAKEWLPYALGDSLRRPIVNFDVRSSVFDVDEMFGMKNQKYRYSQLFFARLSNQTIDGKTAAQAATEIGLGMPEVPPIDMDGHIRATKLVRAGVRFDNVDLAVAARDRQLVVRGASFRMMNGDVQLTGRLGLATPDSSQRTQQPLLLEYKVENLLAEQFVKRFTTFRDQITGEMMLSGTVQMNLDHQLLPERESLAGAGNIAVVDGQIVNWPLLRKVGERIGAARFDTLAFEDWNGRYRFAGSKLLIDDSELKSSELSVRAAGTVDLDGTLDLGATLLLPQQTAQKIPGASTAKLVKAASDDQGRVPVGARIKGTARQPDVALDMSAAGTRAANAARVAAQQEAKKVATRVTDKIVDRVLPADSTATTDSTRSKVESAVSDRLKKLIKPRT